MVRAVPEKKNYRGEGENSGRGSVEVGVVSRIFRQKGSASCELKTKFQPLDDNALRKKNSRSECRDIPLFGKFPPFFLLERGRGVVIIPRVDNFLPRNVSERGVEVPLVDHLQYTSR